ncbi:MAG: hypothetical protein IPM48_09785 [Saprospiraceae bacterium]|nr:hypothetical protein [Saprospiraceae bacterium]
MNPRLILLGLALYGSSCNDSKPSQLEQLSGKWAVYEAWRNDTKTNTFDGAFFDFQSDIMITNYQGDVMESKYIQQSDTLVQMEPETIQYIIEKPHKDTLYLSTQLHGTLFKFLLIKG